MNKDEVTKLFEDWKSEALLIDILGEAKARGAKLRRAGTEWIGPCPSCGGKDRFGVNPAKRVFICRGAAGGDVIAMVQHLAGCDFLGACEQLTGRPPPRGNSKPLSEAEKAEIERKREQNKLEAARRERLEEVRRAERKATAAEVWAECKPIAGTLAEVYLKARGIPVPPTGWPDCIGFHPGLAHDLGRITCPVLVARVDDAAGDLTAIWRIYLSSDGRSKAPVENAKLGLGASAGGAVRIGGVASKIGTCEGLETALAIWTLENYRFPVWSALSTSGLVSIEPPLDVERIAIYPDSDQPRTQKDDRTSLAEDWTPPGIDAARKLKSKLDDISMPSVIEEVPFVPGKDYLDVLRLVTAEDRI